MMVFWLIVFLLALGAVAFVAWPIASGAADDRGAAGPPDRDGGLEAALTAIERDRHYGLIDERSAEEAANEARSQTNTRVAETGAPSGFVARRVRFAAFLGLGAAPLIAVLLYVNLGAPEALNPKTRTADIAAHASATAASQRIEALEAQLQMTPDDFAGWMALGEAYISAGRADGAVRAFAQAAKLNETDAGAVGAYGEALVQEAGGAITGEARAAFEKALALSPGDARARYYLAEARYQVGAIDEAVRAWAGLLNDAPVGAPWFSAVAARMADAAAEAGIEPDKLGLSEAAAARLASAQQAMAGAASAPEDLDAIVGRIHDGSASFEDWVGAASIYMERGETERAKDMLDQAEKRYENAPFVLAEIKKARAQLEAGKPIATEAGPAAGGVRGPTEDQAAAIAALPEGEQRAMIEGMVAGLAERLAGAPDDPEGWRMLGRSYRVLGRPEDSAKAWRELLARESGGAEDWRGLAFALIEQRPDGDTTISAELESVLKKLRDFDADDPLALYNLGYAAHNRGDNKEALTLWTRLRQQLPPDTPLAPTLDRLIAEAQAS